MENNGQADFAGLTPDIVLNSVERALGGRCSNICRPLNSYINRVYEVGRAEGGAVIAKFYRPGRWSRDALQDELDFLSELDAAEVPVVAPLPGANGERLHEQYGTWFAVFPKKGGRPLDEPAAQDWPQLGRLLARLHAVGAARAPRDRPRLHPRHSAQKHLEFILRANVLPGGLRAVYERTVRELLDLIAPRFDGLNEQRIHGDCHGGNILHRPGEGFFLIDFDDCATGPAVQDIWMLLPDRPSAARVELEDLLEGYETFLPFDRATLRLIEPLRALRLLHYTAWCARQRGDGGFTRLAPDWGSPEFWRNEIAELEKQRREILDAADDS